jgi:hypothetical protein
MATLATAGRNAACNAVVDLLDGGTIYFQTAATNEVATCTFGTPAFGDATTGVATANTISDDSDAVGGVVGSVLVRTSGAATIFTCTATVSGGGGDFIMTSLTVGAGDTVSVTSLTVTQPAS